MMAQAMREKYGDGRMLEVKGIHGPARGGASGGMFRRTFDLFLVDGSAIDSHNIYTSLLFY